MLKQFFQHWEIILLIGISLEVLFCFTNLGILAQFPHLGKCLFSLVNHWNNYFILRMLVYYNDLPIMGNVVIHWKTIGIFLLFYQHWYIVTISQYWEMLLFIRKLLKQLFFSTNFDKLEQFSNTGKCWYSLENNRNIPFILTILIYQKN